MSEREYAEIISRNLRRIMYEHNKSQADVSRDLNISKATLSSWMNGTRIPRMEKVDLLCHYFNIRRRDLMEDMPEEPAAESDEDILDKQILDIFKELPDDKKSAALDYLNYLKGTNK